MEYEARSYTRSDFARSHPQPVLLGLEVAAGEFMEHTGALPINVDVLDEDTSDEDTEGMGEPPRKTLKHKDRRSLNARLFGPPGPGHEYLHEVWLRVDGPGAVGRAPDNAYVVDDPSVSSSHGELAQAGGRYVYTDRQSRNGSFHNGVRLLPNDPVAMNPGDELQLGRLVFLFLSPGAFHDYLNHARI